MRLTYPLLDKINNLSDLKALSESELPQLCDELRDFLIYSISNSSGHFSSNLGTVELTVALHYVYDSPHDKIIWDVGHQAYAHKVLTGRKDRIGTIRQYQGLHPFPFIAESEHDILTVGHSSTSLSVATGISLVNQKRGIHADVIPVIGDGAMTAGMAFEALNHVGDIKAPLTIILNDNNMSISPNKGALNRQTEKIFNSEIYHSLRQKSKELIPNIGPLKSLLKSTESAFKTLFSPEIANLYRTMGIEYLGPVDGHNVLELVNLFKRLKGNGKLQLVHVLTTKGKGYLPAEQEPTKYHGVGKFNPQPQAQVQEKIEKVAPKPTYSKVFGDWLVAHAQDPHLMAITPAMIEGSGMQDFYKVAPDKLIDVAIAEQHAVSLATGLAIGGFKPVVAIYSTFLQRAYDQLIHDVAIDNHPVLFAIDRAGIVGEDGQTHQGAFDISYLRCIPNLVVTTASSGYNLEQLLDFGYSYNGVFAVRYPRGQAQELEQQIQYTSRELLTTPITLGKGVKLLATEKDKYQFFKQENELLGLDKGIAILNFGNMLTKALALGSEIGASVFDMRFVKPLDIEIVTQLKNFDLVVILEENAEQGGAASAVFEAMMQLNVLVPSLSIGIPDQFIPPINTNLIEEKMAWDLASLKQRIILKLRDITSLV
ncbi:1-deoxy-D-xylulose-5-phosphate synthase [Psittacicella gerlachiana]|uniref:1-deoxy-D-xylulose-5-phosphate synthase n=1 Tax=Psittacicella gerlachiana TaxID=2028574 RepID=A0A3A1YKF0_9GAMM|nr:1-deoxy-D-xylulose-5-phosphate synthase [Psittacicella gerlachiana]RIY36714.1 1-deoxy-D-xylulose-5-phosphate synthase [Psittacicella gerlachiana]